MQVSGPFSFFPHIPTNGCWYCACLAWQQCSVLVVFEVRLDNYFNSTFFTISFFLSCLFLRLRRKSWPYLWLSQPLSLAKSSTDSVSRRWVSLIDWFPQTLLRFKHISETLQESAKAVWCLSLSVMICVTICQQLSRVRQNMVDHSHSALQQLSSSF